MSDDRESEIKTLKAAVDTRARESARAEAAAEAAEAERSRVLNQLRSEFGVDSREAAEKLLAELEQELEAEMSKVRAGLDGSKD